MQPLSLLALASTLLAPVSSQASSYKYGLMRMYPGSSDCHESPDPEKLRPFLDWPLDDDLYLPGTVYKLPDWKHLLVDSDTAAGGGEIISLAVFPSEKYNFSIYAGSKDLNKDTFRIGKHDEHRVHLFNVGTQGQQVADLQQLVNSKTVTPKGSDTPVLCYYRHKKNTGDSDEAHTPFNLWSPDYLTVDLVGNAKLSTLEWTIDSIANGTEHLNIPPVDP